MLFIASGLVRDASMLTVSWKLAHVPMTELACLPLLPMLAFDQKPREALDV